MGKMVPEPEIRTVERDTTMQKADVILALFLGTLAVLVSSGLSYISGYESHRTDKAEELREDELRAKLQFERELREEAKREEIKDAKKAKQCSTLSKLNSRRLYKFEGGTCWVTDPCTKYDDPKYSSCGLYSRAMTVEY
jgi:hypothetical protein